MTKFEFIVIGGGIIGMMTARELAQNGASVAIFDRRELGMEASWAAGGILSAMRPWIEPPDSAELSEQGKIQYPAYIEALNNETGIDPEYVRSGLVIIEKKHIDEICKWARSKCVKVNHDFEMNSADINLPEQSVLLPDIAQLRPPRLLKALTESLKQHSVSIYENTEITKLVAKNKHFECVEFNGGKVSADVAIVTAGPWSQSILDNISHDINIKPIRGQMLCVKTKESILDKIVLDGRHYFIPRQDGHVLIGSSMEDVGFLNETTEKTRDDLMNWACSISPVLAEAKFVGHWSGLRPSTNNGKPIIGSMLNFKNIYLNTGHFRKGILQAPASAKLLVDNLLGKKSFMDIEKFNMECQKKSLNLA
jgi:glycine oxidase